MAAPSKLTIDAPALAPAKGGLLEAANVEPANGYALYYGVQYVPHLDGRNLEVPAEGTDKTFEPVTADDLTESVPFSTYRGVDVSIVRQHGLAAALVEDAYKRSESYDVEAKVQELVLNPKAVDLTPTAGTAVTNVRLALGLLEQYARDNLSALPLLTGNALALTLVEDALEGTGDGVTTRLGTPVALAGGYSADGPGSATAGPGQAWLYISGQINIWRGQVAVSEGPALEQNRELALAEGSYAASVDGIVAAILVGT